MTTTQNKQQPPMIDYKKILSYYLGSGPPYDWEDNPNYRLSISDSVSLMKEAIKQAIPLILQEAAERAEAYIAIGDNTSGYEDVPCVIKKSITSLSDELILKYTK